MSRTPNYIITERFTVSLTPSDIQELPAGSYVRPIDYRYVPKHVKDDPKNKYYFENTDVFCYCKFGIILIKKDILRQT